jgi:hypothetical protein
VTLSADNGHALGRFYECLGDLPTTECGQTHQVLAREAGFVLMDYFGIARDLGEIARAPVKLHARQRYALLAINVV